MSVDLGVFDSGVDDSGAALGIGEADAHYTVWFEDMTGKAEPALTRKPQPGWAPASGNRWDTVPTPGIDGRVGAGLFTYQTTFDMPAQADPTTASIVGQWAAAGDNANTGQDSVLSTVVRLNGVDMGSGGASGVLTDFSIDSGFVAGENILQFLIELGPAGAGVIDTGLLVDISEASVSVVPLPAAVWLFGAAAIGLGIVGGRGSGARETPATSSA